MLSYCLESRKNTESKNSKIVRAKNEKTTLLSKCAVCDNKGQEASGLLNNLGIKTPLNKIPLLGPLLF